MAGGDKSISREHLEFRRSGEQYVVRTIGRKNGTLVRGEAVEDGEWIAIEPRDRIKVGDVFLLASFLRPDEARRKLMKQCRTCEASNPDRSFIGNECGRQPATTATGSPTADIMFALGGTHSMLDGIDANRDAIMDFADLIRTEGIRARMALLHTGIAGQPGSQRTPIRWAAPHK